MNNGTSLQNKKIKFQLLLWIEKLVFINQEKRKPFARRSKKKNFYFPCLYVKKLRTFRKTMSQNISFKATYKASECILWYISTIEIGSTMKKFDNSKIIDVCGLFG
jgi:hypothetical protein